MSKQALQAIIENENFWAKHRGKPEISISRLTTPQANALYETIDCGLSPENLHCDGEITRTEARRKYNQYMQAVKELKKRGFKVPESCYEIN